MTPAETYARKRLEAETLIRQHAPVSSHAELVALLRPVIALNAAPIDDARIALGASKFGGAPDLPAGFEWPRYQGKSLAFLAQISLREVAPFDRKKQLPTEGHLLFFVALDEDNPIWGEPQQRQGWRVAYARESLHRAPPPADSRWIVAQNTQRVRFDIEWTVAQEEMNALDLNWEDWDHVQESHFGWDVLAPPPHRMLAPAYAPQLPPLTIAANGSQGKDGHELYDESVATNDWQLLLQLDTGAGDFFEDIHDVGWLYFMIRRDDLRSGNFSKIWFNQQGT